MYYDYRFDNRFDTKVDYVSRNIELYRSSYNRYMYCYVFGL